MRVLSNLEFKNSTYILNKFEDFPENPSEGTVIFKENGLYIYSTNITSGQLEWINILDFTRANTSFKFEQDTESTEWVINHNLNTQDLFVIVYDSDGNKQIESEIQFQSDNEIKLIFSEPISGKALLFGASVISSPSNIYTKEEIDELLKNIEIYSTDEKIIGTWIDGKPVYRKCFSGLKTPSSYNNKIDIINTSDMNIDKLITLYGFCHLSSKMTANIPSSACQVGLNDDTGNIYMYILAQSWCNSDIISLIVEYTKTTD